jgi:hypothetical protein
VINLLCHKRHHLCSIYIMLYQKNRHLYFPIRVAQKSPWRLYLEHITTWANLPRTYYNLNRFTMNILQLKQIYLEYITTWTDLPWTYYNLNRFTLNILHLEQIYLEHITTWTYLPWTYCNLNRFTLNILQLEQIYLEHITTWTELHKLFLHRSIWMFIFSNFKVLSLYKCFVLIWTF